MGGGSEARALVRRERETRWLLVGAAPFVGVALHLWGVPLSLACRPATLGGERWAHPTGRRTGDDKTIPTVVMVSRRVPAVVLRAIREAERDASRSQVAMAAD